MLPHRHEEIELKWALTQDGYRGLLLRLPEKLGPGRKLEQHNQFYDSADLRLRAARMNLRLRHENGRVLLTVKHKRETQSITAGVARHDEWEHWLPGAVPAIPTADNLALPELARTALAGAALTALGGFANLRIEFTTERDGLQELLCLDRTDYGQRIDYELEIETIDPSTTAAYWSAQLATWDITYAAQTLTKFARYLKLNAG